MKKRYLPLIALMAFLVLCMSVSSVLATWVYARDPDDYSIDVTADVSAFRYGLFYISKIETVSGSFDGASVAKKNDVGITADIDLSANVGSSATVQVTFYNDSNVSYYYDETVTVSADNDNIVCTVTGLAEAEEIPSKSYAVLTVTWGYAASTVPADTTLTGELNFKFTVDKSSIGDVVANTAVERFADILNNVVSAESYSQLTTAMDARSGFNKASAVTYIGNVAGADDGDSATLNKLFGDDFMSVDLDGDGIPEPVTMMIKRENLDNDVTTGSYYTYTSWGREVTVNGVEMTIYITSADLSNVSRGDDVVVYAATFTLYSGTTQWVQILELTKGTAEANNYSGGWGNADSFNTDTWVSDSGATIESLVAASVANS